MTINKQANLLSNMARETLEQGTVQAMEISFPLLKVLSWKQVSGNAYKHNILKELLPTEERELGQDVVSSEIETVPVITPLRVFTASAKVDRASCIQSDVTDLMAEQQKITAISLGAGLQTAFINTLNKHLKDGTAGVEIKAGLTIDNIDDCLDLMLNCSAIMCNKRTQRELKKLLKAEGYTPQEMNEFGNRVIGYNSIPLLVTEDIEDNAIFFLNTDEESGLIGITNSGLLCYNQDKGVFKITDNEIVCNVTPKTEKSFIKLTIPVGRSK